MRSIKGLLAVFTLMFGLSAFAAPQFEYITVDFEDDVTAREVLDVEQELGIDLQENSIMWSKTKIARVAIHVSELDEVMELLEDTGLTESVEPEIRYSVTRVAEFDNWNFENPDDVADYWYTTNHGPWRMNYTDAWGNDYMMFEGATITMPSTFNEPVSGPNDPLYQEGKQWNMTMIGVEKAWNTAEGEGVVVAVLDTGISTGKGKYPRVPDLKQTCMKDGWNFIDDNEDAYDWHGHGTHVGGTIAQSTNNGIGLVGIAHKACLMPVKVLSDEGWGTNTDIAEAIVWATDHGANVINMSLGGGGFSKVIDDALNYAVKNDVFVACAAGNAGTPRIEYPAAMTGCRAVSSVGKSGNLAFYSSYGDNGDGVFLTAPGGDQRADGQEGGVWQDTVVSGKPDKHGYFPFQGTSMATPHVAGVAALVIETLGPSDYNLEDVDDVLASSATEKGDEAKYGNGLLNASNAVEAAKKKSEGLPWYTWLLASLTGVLSVSTINRIRKR